MTSRYFFAAIALITAVMTACSDDDNFSASPYNMLTFSEDTVRFDTLFSKTPSSTRTFWAFNKSANGIRCSSIRLQNGNQTGYRVNVDGVYLGEKQGYQLNDEEVRKGDSIRVFVELTSPENGATTPQEVSDILLFNLESGVQQKVVLEAWSWDAERLRNHIVTQDTVLRSDRPIVISGMMTVKEGATLTVPAGTTLYMDADAGIDVYGTLKCLGETGNEVVMRGSRLDHMFDYLPYDGVSGQWKGIKIHEQSYGNTLLFTDIHSANDAIFCDSASTEREKLYVSSSTIHNSKGYGIFAENCSIRVENTQVTNALEDCIGMYGGVTTINHCTLAQFYPFDGNRGCALAYSSERDTIKYLNSSLHVTNSIVTGYAENTLYTNIAEETDADVRVEYSLVRTSKEDIDTLKYTGTIFENVEDTAKAGYKNFRKIDTELLQYDFRLREVSLAIDSADNKTALPTDRNATPRDEKPDMGCYEYKAEEKTEEE